MIQREFAQNFNVMLKMTFASSNPPTPARQCGLCGLISGCVRTADTTLIRQIGYLLERLPDFFLVPVSLVCGATTKSLKLS
jgi:hypothetical protein